jgi:putative peptidoglycan lipid II flippase
VLANGRAGDVSAYQAAYMFMLLPHAVFAVSIMTALLPDLAERWAVRDRDGYRRELAHGMRLTALVLIPAAAGYLVLARPIVSLLLEHGAFSVRSARTTAEVLAWFSVGLPAFSGYLLLMRAYQAMQNTRVMFYVYALENGLNIVLGLLLYPVMGVQGLALAFALAYVGGTAVALKDLSRRVGGLEGRSVGSAASRITAAAAVMAVAVAGVSWVLRDADGAALIARLGVSIVVGAGVFLAAARALGVEELAELRSALSRSRPGVSQTLSRPPLGEGD